MRYDAVLFDADETLFDFIAAERAAIGQLLLEVDIDALDGPMVYHEINDKCWKDLEKGLIDQKTLKTRRFWELAQHYGATFDEHRAAERYEELLSMQSILLPGAEETVKRIAEKLPVAIVTNGIARVQRGRMAISPIEPYVSALLISEEVGASKPDPAMIDAALSALGGIAPSRALLVGDSLTSDMRAGMHAGVDNCWYNPRGQKRPDDILIKYEIAELREAAEIALK